MFTGENWITILLVVAGIKLITIGWIVVRYNNRLKRLRIECFDRIEALSSTYEQKLTLNQHEVQENTLLTVARELHDNFNMRLIVASMNLRHIDWNNQDQTKEKVTDSIEQLNESIQGLTDLSRSLNSDLIQSLGLVGALEKEIDRLSRASNLRIHFHVNGEPVFLPEIIEISIFRLFQECFNNIIKHSGTKLVQITITYLSHHVYLMVMDHGVGFSYNEDDGTANGSGSGLQNLRSRIKLIDGQMKIKSTPDEGTSFLFTIPYPHANSNLCPPQTPPK
ncbi:MAG: ATP-binding protein [Chitinophagaceae bacterium]|nr:ATP-binding protein [Chitinophagaceae bacterium]